MASGRVWQARKAKKKRRLEATTAAYGEIELCLKPLLQGTVVSIDPSIGSNSSMPGWAVYSQGELVASGILKIPLVPEVPERLQEVARQVRELYRHHMPDVLVYEQIAARFYGGGGNAAAMASLQKALGAILSVPGPRGFVGLSPQTWKRLVSADYVKSDEEDARQIGRIAIEIAEEIQDREEAKKVLLEEGNEGIPWEEVREKKEKASTARKK